MPYEPSVDLLQDGMAWGTSPRSGAASLYLVKGIAPSQATDDAAKALGLPGRGDKHPFRDDKIAEDVDVVSVIESNSTNGYATLVRVQYKPINWSGLRTRFGTKSVSQNYDFERPIIQKLGSSNVYITHEGEIFRRSQISRIYTVLYMGMSMDQIVTFANANKGRRYQLAGWISPGETITPYLLDNVNVWEDASNNRYVETTFVSTGVVPARPADAFIEGTVALPKLVSLSDYVILRDADGTVEVVATDPITSYALGVPLPWM